MKKVFVLVTLLVGMNSVEAKASTPRERLIAAAVTPFGAMGLAFGIGFGITDWFNENWD